jgi:outer membrane protein assembly factor BamE (lipoprotein component of BamABCDE complex)
MNRIGTVAVIALVAFVLAGVVGCNKVSRENYDKVQPGMTVQQVKDILGNPDETKSGGVNVLGVSADKTTMTWKSGDKNITVTFVGDNVVTTGMSNL